jgi:hypothetical protein
MTPILAELARGNPEQIEAIGGELRRTIAPCWRRWRGSARGDTNLPRDRTRQEPGQPARACRAVVLRPGSHAPRPSPGGLRIFADLAGRYADPASISNLLAAIERFETLLDTVPGGRASIDAQISESSHVALLKREHIAKQASFKAMSFLLGHFCDVLTTTLFLVPSADGRRVDGIEIQRRIGLRRMRPSTPLVLMSLWGDPDDAVSENAIRFETLDGQRGSGDPASFLLSPSARSRCPSSTYCGRAR